MSYRKSTLSFKSLEKCDHCSWFTNFNRYEQSLQLKHCLFKVGVGVKSQRSQCCIDFANRCNLSVLCYARAGEVLGCCHHLALRRVPPKVPFPPSPLTTSLSSSSLLPLGALQFTGHLENSVLSTSQRIEPLYPLFPFYFSCYHMKPLLTPSRPRF